MCDFWKNFNAWDKAFDNVRLSAPEYEEEEPNYCGDCQYFCRLYKKAIHRKSGLKKQVYTVGVGNNEKDVEEYCGTYWKGYCQLKFEDEYTEENDPQEAIDWALAHTIAEDDEACEDYE